MTAMGLTRQTLRVFIYATVLAFQDEASEAIHSSYGYVLIIYLLHRGNLDLFLFGHKGSGENYTIQ
jgi:hypothetical protein